ncbi:DUF421 domain-containing protein [Alkalibacterium iburiense]|uniref:DUF421 domain-containing protein n=1 Tax=Alkalibacterium iburiense TaxID=290589 RepID=A0ABN0XJJ4_9LACT
MYLDIFVKMSLGALAVFIVFRLIGKKAVSELTPFDLLYVLVLGGLLETSIYDQQVSVFHMLFAISIWGLGVYGVEKLLVKTEVASKALQGEPSVLIHKGKINKEAMNRNHIDLEQLRALLRQQGCYTLKEAYYAILEINGSVTVIKKSEKQDPSVLLIDDGRIDHDTLASIDKDEDWLREKLNKQRYSKVEDIFYGDWLPEGELYLHAESAIIDEEERLDG